MKGNPYFVGWSNNHFNNLQFRVPLETIDMTTHVTSEMQTMQLKLG